MMTRGMGGGSSRRSIWNVLRTAAGPVAAACGLAGCQMATPFSGPGYSGGSGGSGVIGAAAGERVVVGVTHAVLDGRKRSVFDEHTRRVVRSLPEHDGYLGHSIRTRVFGHEVWTMTVWRDGAALDAFVRSPVHQEAIRRGMPAVIAAQFMRLEWPATSPPPSWTAIQERLRTTAVHEYKGGKPG